MKRDSWKVLTLREGSPLLDWLHEAAVESWALVRGVGAFFAVRVPQLLAETLGSIYDLSLFGCRVGYQLGKFVGAMSAYLAVLFLPVILLPVWVGVPWLGVAIYASVWSHSRHLKKRALAAAGKGVIRARA